MAEPLLIGILGGMGPLATLDLWQKIIAGTPARRDQDHVPLVVWNVPQIPDRQAALAGRGESPLPALLRAIQQLNALGVSHIALPCNTAHHWYPQLAAASRAPLLHIADLTARHLAAVAPLPARVGLIATEGTLAAGWYQQRLSALGITPLLPERQEMDNQFVPGCYAVKRGELRLGGELLHQLAGALVARGAQRLILACTEVPPALQAVASPLQAIAIDPTHILAQACIDLWLDKRR
ncbi:aspartate/glutamate racemase family protein [Affinibrenneria salicis]|uniref:Aspartate/glutamate racemase family protein n=1 Tax=Affinibrenneria salicis TaxID=2590031 RepID=A0A5J5FZ28_9GAMM|nr:amino acid racemase [Affinibrenneria salicis]KAA8999048.1 aspartate/glutamate racemase family protein [Affinibrenneria salicis]